MLAVKIGHQTSGSAPSTTLRTPNVLGEEKKKSEGFFATIYFSHDNNLGRNERYELQEIIFKK